MIDVEAYYKKYGPMVFRRCRALLKDEESAMDAVQDVFYQVLKRQNKLENTAPSSLLYTIATNVCLNLIRQKQRNPEIKNEELLLTIAGPDDPAERAVNRGIIDHLFKDEAVNTKTIAVLHYLDRLTLEETAEQTGMSVSGVRKRLRNLRAKSGKIKEMYQNG